MRCIPAVLVLLFLAPTLLAQAIDKEKRTRSIKLTERAGIARVQTPVEVTIRFEKDALKDPAAVRILGPSKAPVACQVLDVRAHAATDSFAPAPQTFVQIVFLADVPANGIAVYEVTLEGAQPAGQGLQIAGEAINTGPAVFELHKPSGQLLAITPKPMQDRLVFLQHKERGALPIHWNPDVWVTGGQWGHTSDWNTPVLFKAAQTLPPSSEKVHPYFYREWRGPLLFRQTRWGKMPFVPQVQASVTYTFHAGSPVVTVQSLVKFGEDLAVHTVRNAELVFSRHQFDTAVWITKDGKVHQAPAYDYNDKDKSFHDIVKLPADVPCLGFTNERKGYGVAWVVQSMTNLNKLTGNAADEGAHFYIRDYDEHGKGSPANFLYFVRPLGYREGYLPTTVSAGSLYAANSAIVVFKLSKEPATKYDELLRWQKLLANPLEVLVD